MILETYTTAEAGNVDLPNFLTVACEVTDQPLYSMYNLSRKAYHSMEVEAGANSTTDKFDYHSVYAGVNADGSDIQTNGL